MDDLRKKNGSIIEEVKDAIKQLGDENKTLSGQEGEKKSSILRIRENQYMAVTNDFMAAIKEYQRVQSEFKEQHRQTMIRQVKIAMKDVNDEKAEEIVDSGEFNEENFLAAQVMKSVESTSKSALAEIKETKADLLKLEESMNELAEVCG